MVMLRAFEALCAGFAIAVLVSFAIQFLLKKFAPDWAGTTAAISPGAIVVNLGSSFLAAAAGGYVTAWTASGNPLPYILALGVVVLVLAALSALQQRGKQPIAYLLASVAAPPLGALVGGFVRLRVEGIL